MSEWRDTDTIVVLPQRRWAVTMRCRDGSVVIVRVLAHSIESVIEQVKGRRIACPGDMVDFSVSEAAR